MPMFSCPLLRNAGRIHGVLMKNERLVFLVFLFLSLLQLWYTRYVPSLDGPQHLYNAQVLAELLKGNDLFATFFSVNDTIVGYWTGHFALALFKTFLPAWLAEKFFLSAYVIAMVFSFRYLVRGLQPVKGNFVSYLIFPFIYHAYLLMGYYSFSIAAIFFFLAFGLLVRQGFSPGARGLVMLALILIGLFLSHALVYVFFGMAFVVWFLASLAHDLLVNRDKFRISHWLKALWKVSLAVLPSLLLWVVYIRSVMSINSTVAAPSYSFSELVKFLMRIRQLVGFHHEQEAIGYIPLFIFIAVLVITVTVLLAGRIKDRSARWTVLLDKRNSWIFVSLVFLGLYLFAPDRISAGSLTHRFGLFFFLALITWLSVQKYPPVFHVVSVALLLAVISYTRATHYRYYRNLNRDIAHIEKLADHMEPNSVVYSLNATNNWVHRHFQLYAASDDPLVHLKNPQCQGQFPVVWNMPSLPRCFAGTHEVRPAGAGKVPDDRQRVQVDYVTVFFYDRFMADSTNVMWQQILEEDYTLRYVDDKEKAALFRSRQDNREP